jgi:hypothetical protein
VTGWPRAAMWAQPHAARGMREAGFLVVQEGGCVIVFRLGRLRRMQDSDEVDVEVGEPWLQLARSKPWKQSTSACLGVCKCNLSWRYLL